MEPLGESVEPLGGRDPHRAGRYQLVGRLGSGGTGTVFLGESTSGRRVAVKVVHDFLARDPGFRGRFAREVAAARRVNGFYTAQVVDADVEAPVPWMATRFVAGPSLAARVSRGGPLPIEEVFGVVAGVAEALVSIHEAGLVHRDLKPSHVILAGEGAHVIDFGIARALDGTTRTSTGELPDGFEFVAPEQIQAQPVTAASDVFALGGLLTYAATGTPAFGTGHPGALIHRIEQGEPELSGLSDERLRRLVTACLAKDPADRPTAADVLAAVSPDALTVVARPGESGPVQVAPIRVTGPSVPTEASVPTEPSVPTEALVPTEESTPIQPTPVQPVLAGPTPVEPVAPASRVGRRAVLGGAVLVAGAGAAALAVRATGWPFGSAGDTAQPAGPASRTLTGHVGNVYGVAFSPDGKTLTTTDSNAGAANWDVATGALRVRLVGHKFTVTGAAYTGDGQVITSSLDGSLVFWDAVTGTAQRTIPAGVNGLRDIAVAPGGAAVASVSWNDGAGRIWKRDGTLLHRLPGNGELPGDVGYSPDGRILTIGEPGALHLWDTGTGTPLPALTGARSWGAFTQDGSSLATGGPDGSVLLWDTRSWTVRRTLSGHVGTVLDGVFSRDGGTLVTGSADETARVWDISTGTTRHTLTGHTGLVHRVALTPDGRTVATAGNDGTARLWDAGTGASRRTLPPVLHAVFDVAYSPDGRTLVSAGNDGAARLWDVASGKAQRALTGHKLWVNSVAFAPDGRTLATAGPDDTPRIWDPRAGTTLHILKSPADVWWVAYAPDGRTLATSGMDAAVRIWDTSTGRLVRTLAGHTAPAYCPCAYSPDGAFLAAGGSDTTVRVWDPATGRSVRTLRGHTRGVTGLAFGPQNLLASVSDDTTGRVWDVSTGATLATLVGHQRSVAAVAFAPSGRLVATAGNDRTVRLWDARTGAVRHTFTGYTQAARGLSFSPDGKALATSSADGSIRLWDLTTIPSLL